MDIVSVGSNELMAMYEWEEESSEIGSVGWGGVCVACVFGPFVEGV